MTLFFANPTTSPSGAQRPPRRPRRHDHSRPPRHRRRAARRRARRLLVPRPRAQAQGGGGPATPRSPRRPAADHRAGAAADGPSGQGPLQRRLRGRGQARQGRAQERRAALARLPAAVRRARRADRLHLAEGLRRRRPGPRHAAAAAAATAPAARTPRVRLGSGSRRRPPPRASRGTPAPGDPGGGRDAASGRDRRLRRLPDDAVLVRLQRHLLRHGALPARRPELRARQRQARSTSTAACSAIDGFCLVAGPGGFPNVKANIVATAYLRSPADDSTSTAGDRRRGRHAARARPRTGSSAGGAAARRSTASEVSQ